jgi:poly(A) polymerase Pap1
MAYDSRKNGLRRQEAVGMEELVTQFIRDMKLSSGLGKQRACEAWAKVSGAGRYTLDVSFDKGVMVCVISSSVVRNQLYFQRDRLLKSLNEHLASDELLAGSVEGDVVKTLILR